MRLGKTRATGEAKGVTLLLPPHPISQGSKRPQSRLKTGDQRPVKLKLASPPPSRLMRQGGPGRLSNDLARCQPARQATTPDPSIHLREKTIPAAWAANLAPDGNRSINQAPPRASTCRSLLARRKPLQRWPVSTTEFTRPQDQPRVNTARKTMRPQPWEQIAHGYRFETLVRN